MRDTDDHARGGDENSPDGPAGVAIHNRCKNITINTSILPICNLDAQSSPSSKSNTPDHVVPSEKDLLSPQHRLSTSSGSSSPQTDGSITFRRYAGGPDVSRSSSVLRSGADSDKSPLSPPPCRTQAQKRNPGVKKEKAKRRPRKAMSTASPKKNAQSQQIEENDSDYIIRCICGYADIVGEQIQCEKCEAWQHFGCMGIVPAAVPDCYLCEVCDPVTTRPLQPEQAREYHTALRLADAQSDEEKKRRKVRRTIRRKPSDNTITNPPRQNDLCSLTDKKKADNAPSLKAGGEGSLSGQTSVQNDSMELSRDDRKILQYEEMFKRLEARREKRTKRKRLGLEANSSVGSPGPADVSVRGDDLESHEENTNPPPSPVEIVVKETAAVEIITVVAEHNVITPPELPPRIKKTFRRKELIRSSSVCEQTSNTSQPPVSSSNKRDKSKPRYSIRLKNAASLKAAETGTIGMRIELNCVKKRKKEKEADDSAGQDDLESPSAFPISPPIKKRNRSISFVDSYYSSMGDILSETDMQKAQRRNRAFTTSQELEKAKGDEERTRLYHLYGVKKALCARYLQQPTGFMDKVEPKQECTTVDGRFRLNAAMMDGWMRFTEIETPSTVCPGITETSPISAVTNRAKTVRAMIEESANRNRELGNIQIASHQRTAILHRYRLPSEPSSFRAECREQDPVGADQPSTSSPVAEKQATCSFKDGLMSPRLVLNGHSNYEGAREASDRPNNSLATTTPKKLSLAEYKQLKLSSQNTLGSSEVSKSAKCSIPLLPLPSTPIKTGHDRSSPRLSPSMTTPRSIQVVVSLSPPRYPRVDSAPAPSGSPAPPRLTSVIQRIGSVNNLISLHGLEETFGRTGTSSFLAESSTYQKFDMASTSHPPLDLAASFVQNFRPPQLPHGAKDVKI